MNAHQWILFVEVPILSLLLGGNFFFSKKQKTTRLLIARERERLEGCLKAVYNQTVAVNFPDLELLLWTKQRNETQLEIHIKDQSPLVLMAGDSLDFHYEVQEGPDGLTLESGQLSQEIIDKAIANLVQIKNKNDPKAV